MMTNSIAVTATGSPVRRSRRLQGKPPLPPSDQGSGTPWDEDGAWPAYIRSLRAEGDLQTAARLETRIERNALFSTDCWKMREWMARKSLHLRMTPDGEWFTTRQMMHMWEARLRAALETLRARGARRWSSTERRQYDRAHPGWHELRRAEAKEREEAWKATAALCARALGSA